MINPADAFATLRSQGVGFFTGVPDSLLKDFCAFLTDHAAQSDHVIAANEGSAMAIAAGYHLATGGLALVYLQNSGVGNLVNPLLSLTDVEVYSLPMVVMIGWRGEPGVHDEPQHVKQGRVMLAMLDAMEMPYRVLADDPSVAAADLEFVTRMALDKQCAVALVVRKGTFSPYASRREEESSSNMSREEAIAILAGEFDSTDVVVSTTGMISRELFEIRQKCGQGIGRDFLTVGSMGHASSIAFGISAQRPERQVFCLDGDGAMLMHLGAVAINGQRAPANFKHIVLNNGAHDSVGGQPTVGFSVEFGKIAQASGYRVLDVVCDPEALRTAARELRKLTGPVLLEVRVRKGARKDLGRPTSTPLENKQALMRFLGVSPS